MCRYRISLDSHSAHESCVRFFRESCIEFNSVTKKFFGCDQDDCSSRCTCFAREGNEDICQCPLVNFVSQLVVGLNSDLESNRRFIPLLYDEMKTLIYQLENGAIEYKPENPKFLYELSKKGHGDSHIDAPNGLLLHFNDSLPLLVEQGCKKDDLSPRRILTAMKNILDNKPVPIEDDF